MIIYNKICLVRDPEEIYNIYFFLHLLYMIKNKDSIFIKLLKEHTNIDINFIDTFLKNLKLVVN